ncbi:SDR family oxidoreductase [Mesorhizobium caraganae]|uniref:SDR family NAD(P)-dependent oxidoreductase n=1 Tax=Mesorhizobium caraganae TaxID=483206 RepID=UPI0019397E12|nr:SDR family oxidoreductase [Mesorhizobium caraganae]MBM2715917.1 SDR family oxidoreductase [Mesorhizobium caraganae]
MTGIEKKTAVITGAAGGIGQAISRQFVAKGFRVVAGDAEQAGLDKLEAELNRTGQNVWSKAGDLRNNGYCEDLIEYSVQATGRLDVLVNNAGIITPGDILQATDDDWERTFEINLTSISHTCRKAISHMKGHGGGAIVNVASCWELYPGTGHAAHCLGKAAVAAFSRCLGRDHAGDGIRVNAVCPNEVSTPMLRTGFARRGFTPGTAMAEANNTVPLGRIAEPEDIADVVFFLCSDAARSIAGSAVEVNGAKPVY